MSQLSKDSRVCHLDVCILSCLLLGTLLPSAPLHAHPRSLWVPAVARPGAKEPEKGAGADGARAYMVLAQL